jgi:FkbM family methyltransferase
MRTARLTDGTEVFCLTRPEARALDAHIDGYFQHGITVSPGDVVLDVGANIGLFGVRAAQRTDGRARVFAFEPVPPIFDVLSANAERHGRGGVVPVRRGLARERGEITISYYPRSPGLSSAHPEIWGDGHETLAQAVLGGARNAPTGMQWGRWLPEPVCRLIAKYLRGRVERVTCPTLTVSEFLHERGLDRIDLLKVDVEGAELDVILGVADGDWPRVRQVVAEVHDVDGRVATVTELLRRHGFTKLTVEAEKGFEQTPLRNVFALRE